MSNGYSCGFEASTLRQSCHVTAGDEVCPEDLWLSGEQLRAVWRIAYHAAGYAHLYLYDEMASWKPWEEARNDCAILVGDVEEMTPYSTVEMLDFVDLIVS